jgi:hypothetical protein
MPLQVVVSEMFNNQRSARVHRARQQMLYKWRALFSVRLQQFRLARMPVVL